MSSNPGGPIPNPLYASAFGNSEGRVPNPLYASASAYETPSARTTRNPRSDPLPKPPKPPVYESIHDLNVCPTAKTFKDAKVTLHKDDVKLQVDLSCLKKMLNESLDNTIEGEMEAGGGKKRKRKTVRKSKKSKSVRKHKKTGKKHAKRHSKTMKRKGKQHHKRTKKHHKKTRK